MPLRPPTPTQPTRPFGAVLDTTPVTALAGAPAQNANTFVVTADTAEELGLRRLSDLREVAPTLTFGGPPECPNRPLCLRGLEEVYGLRFGAILALDPDGHTAAEALDDGAADVALLFTTDPEIDARALRRAGGRPRACSRRRASPRSYATR